MAIHTYTHTQYYGCRFRGTLIDNTVPHGQIGLQKVLRDSGAKLLSNLDMSVKMCTAAAKADMDTLRCVYVCMCMCA